MNSTTFKTELESKLSKALRNSSSFELADRLYSNLWRSKPYLASEYMTMLQSEWEDLSDEERKFCYIEPTIRFEEEFGVEYSPELLICELCNYKGEGEGPTVLYEKVKHLPIFVDKNTSFNLFS